MKFQWVGKIPVVDPEIVLRAMEDRLRTVSSEVVREGDRITLMGLGPSPRAMNRRDRTVIDVRVEDGFTTIAAEIAYQASSLLGDVSQDAVVRAKFERVFAEMQEELGLKVVSTGVVEAHREAQKTTPANMEPSHGLPKMRFAAEVSGAPPQPLVPQMKVETAHEVPSGKQEASTKLDEAVTVSEVGEAEPKIIEKAAEKSVPDKISKDGVAAVPGIAEKKETGPLLPTRIAPVAIKTVAEGGPKKLEPVLKKRFSPADQQIPKFTSGVPSMPEPIDTEKKSSRLLQWSAWVAAFVVLVLAPAAWLYLPRGSHADSAASQPTQPSPAVSSALAATTESAPAPVASVEVPVKEQEPTGMVKDWEAALQSADATKQAAFYADPVDRYFIRHNVSRNLILADKRSQIEKRPDGWSVAMERVRVQQQGDTASVHLIKSFTVRKNGKLTSQWYVPSLLQLKRADGRWQIASERDLGWANTLDDLE